MKTDLARRFNGRKIIVAGDVMLDEYLKGEVRRISPEAPVPIVEIHTHSYVPGGAGNVAANVVSLGGQALLCGVIGCDYQGQRLLESLEDAGVSTIGLFPDAERPTTTKTRIIAHNQQVARVDQERRTSLNQEAEERLLRWIEDHIPEADACVLSDYGKGLVTTNLARKYIHLARSWHKPLIADPKGLDFTKYRGATVITPNTHEAEKASNCEINVEDDLNEVYQRLRVMLEGTALLVTRGAQGMSLFFEEGSPLYIPTVARNVFDVTGAGDTVVSILAMSLAAGLKLDEAARLSNQGAGIVVGKVGTASVALEELQQFTFECSALSERRAFGVRRLDAAVRSSVAPASAKSEG